MPGIATGEVFSWPEGKLYLYASASGTTSGSGIGYAEGATVRFTYGWKDRQDPDNGYRHFLTGRRVDLMIDMLYGDKVFFALANASAAVNGKFEALLTGVAGVPSKSAQYVLYSGVIDQLEIKQTKGNLFAASYQMHANLWSGFGQ